jgi:CRP-like cAMP-binding protein
VLLTNGQINAIDRNRPAQEKRIYIYEKGDCIPFLASGFWQVDRGVVQLSRVDWEGNEVTLGWATANTSFGVCLSEYDRYQAVALSKASLRWFSQNEIFNSPYLSRIFMEQLNRRIVKTEELLSIASIRRVEDRLMQLLLFLQEEIGEPVAEGSRLGIRFTHQTLSNAICTTRVTVTRLLKDLQLSNKICFDSKRHIIVKQYLRSIK